MNVDIWQQSDSDICPQCASQLIEFRIVESSDGGHEDVNLRCLKCKHSWWVDGVDS